MKYCLWRVLLVSRIPDEADAVWLMRGLVRYQRQSSSIIGCRIYFQFIISHSKYKERVHNARVIPNFQSRDFNFNKKFKSDMESREDAKCGDVL